MLRFCEGKVGRGISGKVSGLPLLKLLFLPNTAQCDTPSIPSQNNCSLRDEVSPPKVFFTQALYYQSHRRKTDINRYN